MIAFSGFCFRQFAGTAKVGSFRFLRSSPSPLLLQLRGIKSRSEAQQVISRFEQQSMLPGTLPNTGAVREYVRALNFVGRGDDALRWLAEGRQLHLKSAGESASWPLSSSVAASAASPSMNSMPSFNQQTQSMGSMGGAAPVSAASDSGMAEMTAPGTPNNPLHVLSHRPQQSTREKFWGFARFLIGSWLLIALISAYAEEFGRGIGGGGASKNFTVYTETDPDDLKRHTFSDVQGVDEAKEELQEIVEFLRDPQKFTRLGGKLPKGVLLTGPPGTGKTLLARAIAGEAGVPFFHCSGSEFDEMFVGVGAKRVRELFAAAKKRSPCIIFIDEIDAVGSMRNPRDQQFAKMTLNQLLVELDGFNQSSGIIVVGATNFPESLDKALVRPGRFDRTVTVALPDVKGRLNILKVHTKKVPLDTDAKLNIIARGTPGFSGADLANLVNYAALRAAALNKSVVSMVELEWAKDRILMGAERKNAVISEINRKMVAYHEAGHALVAMLTSGALPIHKATIMPRGPALGMVSQLPEGDELNWTKKQLLARLDVAMGGRCAEELVFGDDEITSGASSDLEQATNLARAMIHRFAMGTKDLGPVLWSRDAQDYSSLSTQTREAIEREVRTVLDASYARAKKLLEDHRVELQRVAEALLEEETLTREELEKVVKGQWKKSPAPTSNK